MSTPAKRTGRAAVRLCWRTQRSGSSSPTGTAEARCADRSSSAPSPRTQASRGKPSLKPYSKARTVNPQRSTRNRRTRWRSRLNSLMKWECSPTATTRAPPMMSPSGSRSSSGAAGSRWVSGTAWSRSQPANGVCVVGAGMLMTRFAGGWGWCGAGTRAWVTGAGPRPGHRGGSAAAAAARSSTLPDMIVRTCSVMCWSGQSHQARSSRRAMSASLWRRRISLAGLPPTMP